MSHLHSLLSPILLNVVVHLQLLSLISSHHPSDPNLLVFFPTPSSHLAYDAVLHVCLLVAALFAHQCDLQLTEGFGQDVALREELPPLHNVGF